MDYITQYLVTIRERKVIPDVKPGYMKELLPDSAPTEPEDWENIFNDIERVIMPGVSLCFCLLSQIHSFEMMAKGINFTSVPTGSSLAEPSNARLLPRSELMALLAWGHAVKCYQLYWILLGKSTNNKQKISFLYCLKSKYINT